jgi:hypothetical protein
MLYYFYHWSKKMKRLVISGEAKVSKAISPKVIPTSDYFLPDVPFISKKRALKQADSDSGEADFLP